MRGEKTCELLNLLDRSLDKHRQIKLGAQVNDLWAEEAIRQDQVRHLLGGEADVERRTRGTLDLLKLHHGQAASRFHQRAVSAKAPSA